MGTSKAPERWTWFWGHKEIWMFYALVHFPGLFLPFTDISSLILFVEISSWLSSTHELEREQHLLGPTSQENTRVLGGGSFNRHLLGSCYGCWWKLGESGQTRPHHEGLKTLRFLSSLSFPLLSLTTFCGMALVLEIQPRDFSLSCSSSPFIFIVFILR